MHRGRLLVQYSVQEYFNMWTGGAGGFDQVTFFLLDDPHYNLDHRSFREWIVMSACTIVPVQSCQRCTFKSTVHSKIKYRYLFFSQLEKLEHHLVPLYSSKGTHLYRSHTSLDQGSQTHFTSYLNWSQVAKELTFSIITSMKTFSDSKKSREDYLLL